MRTISVDADHCARFEKTAKNVYRFAVVHTSTGRELVADSVRVPRGATPSEAEIAVSSLAVARLRQTERQRLRTSARFVDGKTVANAPALSPVHAAARAAGDLDIAAEIPTMLIRQAMSTVPAIPGESPDSWRNRAATAALDMGRKVLIGAADALILGIARGELTLSGSLRTGVTVVRVGA